MSIKEITDILESYTIPCTFSHFTSKVTPPFMVYLVPDSDNFSADNITYFSIKNLQVELYSRVDTITEEEKFEEFITAKNIRWEKVDQTWIDEDKVHLSRYNLYG